MKLEKFLEHVNAGRRIETGSDLMKYNGQMTREALKITMEINNSYHDPDELTELFSKLFNRDIDKTVRIIPPFSTDFGKNIHFGKNIYVNAGCRMQDQGGIYIGDGTLIGHNAVFATLNHDLDPDHRHDTLPAPIHVGRNVWIGANVTILAGVSIGDNAVIAAGAVVTKDVKENTVVGGVPAKYIKNIQEGISVIRK